MRTDNSDNTHTEQLEQFDEVTGGYSDYEHDRAAKRISADICKVDAPTGHTPGPWRTVGGGIIADKHGWKGAIIAPAGTITHKDLDNGMYDNLRGEANARLIAASPDLLEALQAVMRHCVTPAGMPDKGKGRTREQQAAFDAARAAIARATR